MKETKKETQKKKRNSRQIVAMVGVILLILLYIVTLITAIVDHSQSAKWFRICLFATFALPLIIWIYSWMYGRLTGKAAIGDPNTAGASQSSTKETDPYTSQDISSQEKGPDSP